MPVLVHAAPCRCIEAGGLAYNGDERRRTGLAECAACGSFDDAKTRDTCVKCMKEHSPGNGCAACVFEHWGNAEACLACAAAGAPDTIFTAICSDCIVPARGITLSGMNIERDRCIACATAPRRSAAARMDCPHCAVELLDAAGVQLCLACIDAVPNIPDGAEVVYRCGLCSSPQLRDAGLEHRCQDCIRTRPDAAQSCTSAVLNLANMLATSPAHC